MPRVESRDGTIEHRTRGVAWRKDDPQGAEFAIVELEPRRLRAAGVAIGSHPEPYRLSFELSTREEYLADRAVVETQGACWRRRVELRRSAAGRWSASTANTGELEMKEAGEGLNEDDLDDMQDALDVDLGLSPVFNSLPVLRHGLHEGGGPRDFVMIWISVPDLSLHASPQRYTFRERRSEQRRVVRFEAIGPGEDFVADVEFDADGLVVDYPGIATRIER